jgi:non-canonical (house-cleaning) NTP pyrophosphatase
MKFILGSKSERKIAIAEKVIRELFKDDEIIVEGVAAQSGVSETPFDKETFDGARNRSLGAKEKVQDADYYIGLESGLVERYGHIYEEAWTVIITKKGEEYCGYSSGLKVPDSIIKKMDEMKKPHYEVMSIIEAEIDAKTDSDTWGTYSGGLITREVSLEESLRNVLIQIVAPDQSFFKKK